MNKGFTLVETMAAATLLLMAVLSSCRILVAALHQTRQAALRFRMIEALDYYRNFLSSLPMTAPELTSGAHSRSERGLRIGWRVEDADGSLKRIHLETASGRNALPLLLYRSRFIQEVPR